MTIKKLVELPAQAPAHYEIPDIAALQALEQGIATPEQQKRVLGWVINNACGTYDLEYRSYARDHAFASGRRFVGLQVLKMFKLNAGKLKRE